MRHGTLFTIATLTACLLGCSQEEILQNSQGDTQQIVFTPMEFGEVTRGTNISKSDIISYGVSASIYSASNSYTSAGCGSYWFNEEVDAQTGKSGYYWPGASYRVSFFAYAPYGNAALTVRSKDDLGYPVYTYTVPTAIANQVDFITADVTDHSGAGITEPVSLTFSHQLTDVRFKVYNKNSEALTVQSVAVYGVRYSGTLSGADWTLNPAVNSPSANPFVLTCGTSVDAGATVDVTGTSNHFIMLPQTIATGTEVFVVKTIENDEEKTYSYTLQDDMTLEKSKSYTYTLELGENLMTVDPDTDIEDWETDLLNIFIANFWDASDNTEVENEKWNTDSDTGVDGENWNVNNNTGVDGENWNVNNNYMPDVEDWEY